MAGSEVSIFAQNVEKFKSEFDDFHRVQTRSAPVFQVPDEVNEDMLKTAIGLRLESIRAGDSEADTLLRGQRNLTKGEICSNYTWVYGSSTKLKTCSHGDEYVKLETSSSGVVMVTNEADKKTAEDFYRFAEKAVMDMQLTTILFPLFLFNFLEHFTFMFFGVTLKPNETVDKARFSTNNDLWVNVMQAYVKCIKHVSAQLGEKHVELSVMCYQLRQEITDRIHERHVLIIDGYHGSPWDQRFETFADAVMCGMSMRTYIFRNTDSLFSQVQSGIMNMRFAMSVAESDRKELRRMVTSLRSDVSRLVASEEAGAAGSKRTRK